MRVCLIAALSILMSACHVIRVQQPIVVGQPGKVYQTTEAPYSIDIVNNTNVAGDVMMGRVVLYENLKSGNVENVGFHCPGISRYESSTHRARSSGSRNDYIYFKPYDEALQTISKNVSITCRNGRKLQWKINSVPRLRVQR